MTVRPRVPKIGPMLSRMWRLALAAAVAAACHEGLQPTPTCPPGFVGICGLVTVLVPLPDSLKDTTEAVFIVAYKSFPTAPESLFNFLPLPPPTIPTSPSTYPYSLKVPNGRYEWVLAVWKKKGTLTTQSADSLLREVGFYKDGGDTTAQGIARKQVLRLLMAIAFGSLVLLAEDGIAQRPQWLRRSLACLFPLPDQVQHGH